MKTCREIIEWFNERWPEALACEWDNVGLLAGRKDKEVKRIYVALDATDEVVEAVFVEKADMLITHHPLIFGGIKKINDGSFVGRRLLKLIQADISYYASHTSFDIAEGGMADLAAEKLGLFAVDEKPLPLEITGEQNGKPVGIGKVGNIRKDMAGELSVKELAGLVKDRFQIPSLTVYGNEPDKKPERIAISPGSGKSMMKAALLAGADVLITGDMGHHEGIDLAAEGVTLMDAGHYGLEHIFIDAVAEELARWGTELEIVKAPLSYPCQVV